jgi:DNA-directed RNA polymerase specialized sigma24 family protein
MGDGRRHELHRNNDRFPTTRWSIVRAAGNGATACARQAALHELCRAYRKPLFEYLRHVGYHEAQADDLTQGFLLSVLEGACLEPSGPARSSFRHYLLGALKHYASDLRKREGALKRGGGITIVGDQHLDGAADLISIPDDGTPDAAFHRRWACAVLEKALDRLRGEYERVGRQELYDRLKSQLTGDNDRVRYRELGAQLKMSEAAVKIAVHRLRRRYARVIREVIAETVGTPQDIESELRHLLEALSHEQQDLG